MNFAKDLSFEQKHRFVEFRAEQSSYSSANGGEAIINVDIGLASGEYVDMTDIRLVGDITYTFASGAPYNYAASSWMRDFSVRSHNQQEIGNQCVNYNRFVKVEKVMKSSADNAATWEKELELADGSALTTAVASEFAHKPLVNIFTHDGYYPAFAHMGFQVRVNLADVADCGSTITAYTINNLRFECRLVSLKPEVHNQVLNQLSSDEGIIFDFESTEGTTKTIDGSTQPVYQFGRVAHKLKRVQVVEQTTADPTSFDRNNISSYRFRLGNEYSTSTPIQVGPTKTARHLLHYLRAHKLSPEEMNLYGNASNDGLFATTKFVVAQTYDMGKIDELISSPNSKGLDLELHLNRSAGGSAGTTYLFKTEDRRLQILMGAQVQQLS